MERVLEALVEAMPGDHPATADALWQTQWAWPNIRLKLLAKAGRLPCPLPGTPDGAMSGDSVDRLVAAFLAGLASEDRAAA